jgi:hypothetical protein
MVIGTVEGTNHVVASGSTPINPRWTAATKAPTLTHPEDPLDGSLTLASCTTSRNVRAPVRKPQKVTKPSSSEPLHALLRLDPPSCEGLRGSRALYLRRLALNLQYRLEGTGWPRSPVDNIHLIKEPILLLSYLKNS